MKDAMADEERAELLFLAKEAGWTVFFNDGEDTCTITRDVANSPVSHGSIRECLCFLRGISWEHSVGRLYRRVAAAEAEAREQRWTMVRPDSFGGDITVVEVHGYYGRRFTVYGRNSDLDAQWLADRLNLLDLIESVLARFGKGDLLGFLAKARGTDG